MQEFMKAVGFRYPYDMVAVDAQQIQLRVEATDMQGKLRDFQIR